MKRDFMSLPGYLPHNFGIILSISGQKEKRRFDVVLATGQVPQASTFVRDRVKGQGD
jgi:hypothetical protein